MEDEEGNEVIDIALVHAAYSRAQSRLRCFAKLVQVCPDVAPRMREISREKEPEVVSRNVYVDIFQMRFLIWYSFVVFFFSPREYSIDLFSFVCLLFHCRPRDGTLENYIFEIQTYPRENK